MCRFEHRDGIAGVRTRSDADTPNLSCQRIGNVIAVEIERRDHVVLVRTQQYLLQKGICDRVFNDNSSWQLHPRAAVYQLRAELTLGQGIAPIAKTALGELHDIAFVHQGHRTAIVVYCVLKCLAHQALGSFPRHRFDTDS